MSSIIFQNENAINNNREYQNKYLLNTQKNKLPKKIENNNLRTKLLNKIYLKDFSLKNIKIKNLEVKTLKDSENNNKENELNKRYFDISQENRKILKSKSFFPLLKNDYIKKEKILTKPISLINLKEMNKKKDINFNDYLYLEYKKNNNQNKSTDEATYIEINPFKIITFLNQFPNIKQIFQNLSIKINKRDINLKKIDNSDSKINIDEIFNDLEKSKRNLNKNNDFNVSKYLNRKKASTTKIALNNQNKNNYSIQDLFLFDIINKVIKKSIFLHDKRNQKIDEEFMINEYKNQIKNLKIFFDQKIKEERGELFFGDKNEQFFSEEKINPSISLLIKSKFNNNSKNNFQDNKKYNNTNILNNSNLSLYNLDIGPKINIIDFNELFNKIYRQRAEIRNNNTNNNDNFMMKFFDLNKKKIKFENLLIEEKTKLIKENKKNKNIFIDKNIKYNTRNKFNRKLIERRILIRNRLFNENNIKKRKDNIMDISRKISLDNSVSEKTFSTFKDIDFLKIINIKETKMRKTREKINIEKLNIKNDFGIAKVGFKKTINKIGKINNAKFNEIKKKMKINNFSFLNTIYGKINTQRKIKINEIDYKEELRQKGFQLLFEAFKKNPIIELNKNMSVEDISLSNKYKNKIKTVDKATNTKKTFNSN